MADDHKWTLAVQVGQHILVLVLGVALVGALACWFFSEPTPPKEPDIWRGQVVRHYDGTLCLEYPMTPAYKTWWVCYMSNGDRVYWSEDGSIAVE